MNDIHLIYKNSFGVSFLWKQNMNSTTNQNSNRVQVVFKETGLYLTHKELKHLKKCVEAANLRSKQCKNCPINDECKQLLETPFIQVSFALNNNELTNMDDLISGTLVQLEIDQILSNFGIS